ncbi:hypothetical protein [Streptomyces sp. NPDC091217]|uniref:hypothetical protein n=1 Tax=Streptomyces sp. NPDC091217 TaxID=3365975 RepID=UPI003806A54D
MHDSASSSPSPDPQPPSDPAPGPTDDSTSGIAATLETIRTVIAWYNQQLLAARRAGDQQRLE